MVGDESRRKVHAQVERAVAKSVIQAFHMMECPVHGARAGFRPMDARSNPLEIVCNPPIHSRLDEAGGGNQGCVRSRLFDGGGQLVRWRRSEQAVDVAEVFAVK